MDETRVTGVEMGQENLPDGGKEMTREDLEKRLLGLFKMLSLSVNKKFFFKPKKPVLHRLLDWGRSSFLKVMAVFLMALGGLVIVSLLIGIGCSFLHVPWYCYLVSLALGIILFWVDSWSEYGELFFGGIGLVIIGIPGSLTVCQEMLGWGRWLAYTGDLVLALVGMTIFEMGYGLYKENFSEGRRKSGRNVRRHRAHGGDVLPCGGMEGRRQAEGLLPRRTLA